MKILGTDFVMFLVSDLTRAVKFYRDVLGLRCDIESLEHQWAEFDCGNVTLALKGDALPPGGRASSRIALAIDNPQSAHAELVKQGVRVNGAPVDSGFCVAVEVCDPDGNLVILHQRADGSVGQSQKPV
jgi:catechol 2,3-dioxygenase-like lactoylglutathione lyase family enzyme